MSRIPNQKNMRAPANPDAKVGWLVWGVGTTEGTPFAALASKSGWWDATHPYIGHADFDSDHEWAIVMICSLRELQTVASNLESVNGWSELAQVNKGVAPGYDRVGEDDDDDEDEEESEDEDDDDSDDEEEESDEEESEDEDDSDEDEDEDDDEDDSDDA